MSSSMYVVVSIHLSGAYQIERVFHDGEQALRYVEQLKHRDGIVYAYSVETELG